MPNYRRNYVPGGTYFFTVVTHHRRPILTSPCARGCLRDAFNSVMEKRPFVVVAIVLLPDHMHTVWSLPSGDSQYSLRWAQIKERFTRNYLRATADRDRKAAVARRRRARSVWQERYWEHTCRDEDDLKRCVDYVHYNPVKHGLVRRVVDYPWSSFHRFVRLGEYTPEWGSADPCPDYHTPELDWTRIEQPAADRM